MSRERLKAMKALNALYAKYANVLVEIRTLVVKKKNQKSETKLHMLCYDMYNLIDSLPYLVIGLIKNMQ